MDGYNIYQRIQRDVATGNIFSLSRANLQEYVAALSVQNAYTHFGQSEFPGACETVRMALATKISEDANLQAKKESRIALIVSTFALVVGIVSAIISLWVFLFPSPLQVYSTKNNPVIIESSISR